MRRTTICVYLGPADRAELQALLTNRNTLRKLNSRTGMSKPTVWHWQQRYLDEGVSGLKRLSVR